VELLLVACDALQANGYGEQGTGRQRVAAMAERGPDIDAE